MTVAVTNPALAPLTALLVFDLQIDGERVNLTTSETQQVTITFQEAQHESVVITTQLTKTQITRFVNKPVSFRFGGGSHSNTWYGYVVAVLPNRDFEVDTIVDINCIGVTFPMQNGTPKFVRNITAPDMFAAMICGGFRPDISAGYNLGAQVDVHPFSWPVLSQTDESDWKFLLTLANRIGYAVYTYQGVVRLVKPLRVLTETPIFQTYIKGDNILDASRTLLDWNATTQSLNIRDNVQPAFGFFDGTVASVSQPVVSTPSSATQLVSPYRMLSESPVRERKMADTYVEAWNNMIDFWNNQATARIQGDAHIYPGMNISVQVSGTPNGRNEYDGVWLVRGVRHSLTHSSFQTQLTLARDSTVVPTSRQSKWFWNAKRGAPRTLLDPSTNRWKSSWGSSPEFINPLLAA